MSSKINAGDSFPTIKVTNYDGSEVLLGNPRNDFDWQAIFVYRGKHCPICTKYLSEIATYTEKFADVGVDIIAVSADSQSQLQKHLEEIDINYPIAYGLTEAQMKSLGLYISEPRSDKETDHNFSEPALFVVNEEGRVHIVELANAPFVRPKLDTLVSGLGFIRDPENDYPIRGKLTY
ncbi:peroxiredoxin family protein [Alteromonas sp. C1M14]|uniref:peroxiredoxin family protein n=1 Tax=Alteromonas sp. C1M14 TaxID=2841567 RepID=UPI001C08DB12|nr:peroxiredoxin family protein [Alteromonas sp. C1M14]MBU2976873.1 peroxiredoxin family protein [Alteromonas sp. C1M14]